MRQDGEAAAAVADEAHDAPMASAHSAVADASVQPQVDPVGGLSDLDAPSAAPDPPADAPPMAAAANKGFAPMEVDTNSPEPAAGGSVSAPFPSVPLLGHDATLAAAAAAAAESASRDAALQGHVQKAVAEVSARVGTDLCAVREQRAADPDSHVWRPCAVLCAVPFCVSFPTRQLAHGEVSDGDARAAPAAPPAFAMPRTRGGEGVVLQRGFELYWSAVEEYHYARQRVGAAASANPPTFAEFLERAGLHIIPSELRATSVADMAALERAVLTRKRTRPKGQPAAAPVRPARAQKAKGQPAAAAKRSAAAATKAAASAAAAPAAENDATDADEEDGDVDVDNMREEQHVAPHAPSVAAAALERENEMEDDSGGDVGEEKSGDEMNGGDEEEEEEDKENKLLVPKVWSDDRRSFPLRQTLEKMHQSQLPQHERLSATVFEACFDSKRRRISVRELVSLRGQRRTGALPGGRYFVCAPLLCSFCVSMPAFDCWTSTGPPATAQLRQVRPASQL